MDLQGESSNQIEKKQNFFQKKIVILFFGITLCIGFGIGIALAFFSIKSNSVSVKKPHIISKESQYIAGELVIEIDQKIVSDINAFSKMKSQLKRLGIEDIRPLYEDADGVLARFYLITFSKGKTVVSLHTQILQIEGIVSSQPNYILRAQKIPDDVLYNRQWNLPKIGLERAWDSTTGSEETIVAVVDSGIDYTHQEFSSQIIKGKDFSTCEALNFQGQTCFQKPRDDDPMDDNGHGSHVAGIVAAVSNNKKGIASVNWKTKILAVKVLGREGLGIDEDIYAGIRYAVDNKAQVINLSLGGPGFCSPFQQAMIDYAKSKGVLIVVASGNEKRDVASFTPASCKGVVVVGATDENDNRAEFSNYGSQVTLSAPGTKIVSLKTQNCYEPFCKDKVLEQEYVVTSGTSMAAPHVSGALALLLGIKKEKTETEVLNCILKGADAIKTDLPVGKRINVYNAMKECGFTQNQSTPTPLQRISPSFGITPTPFSLDGSCTVEVVSVDKKNNDFDTVGVRLTGQGGEKVDLMLAKKGQKGSESTNRFSIDGFFSSDFASGISKGDNEKFGNTANQFGLLGTFESESVFVGSSLNSLVPTYFSVYEWERKYKKNPQVSNTTDFIGGKWKGYWYFLGNCNGGIRSCSKEVLVRIPKNNSVYFFCSVRGKNPSEDLVCMGNPVCGYNNGPEVGSTSTIGCAAWKKSCSESDFVVYEGIRGAQGVQIQTFSPE